jgi:hypothetical protein
MKTIKELKELAQDMIEADVDRNRMNDGMDNMFKMKYSLPQSMSALDWVRLVISTDPHDQIRGGTRVLSTLDETLRINSYSDSAEMRDLANRMEKALKSNMKNACRRRSVNVISDLVMSGLLYDEICLQVLYLPWQNKIKGIKGNRKKAMDRFGPYVVIPHKPSNVHTQYSNYMMEAVLSVTDTTTSEVLKFWGDTGTAKLKKDDAPDTVTVFDYWDYDQRMVWCVDADAADGKEIVLVDEEMDLPFIPWVSRRGGTTLQGEAEHQRLPLMYATYQSKAWETQNISQTLAFSEGIARAASPRWKKTGPGAENIEIDYGDPSGAVVVGPGQDAQPMQPPMLDQGMMEIVNQSRQTINRSGISEILLGAGSLANVAYSTINMTTQSAMGVLKPYKSLAEESLADAYTLFILWASHNGDSIKGIGLDKDKKSKLFDVKNSEIKPDDMVVEVSLNPDVPVDRQQKINGAVMMKERLGVDEATALEYVGESDPESIKRRKVYDTLFDTHVQQYVKKQLAQVDLEFEVAKTAAIMQLQQQMQPQQPNMSPQLGQPPPMVPPQPQSPTPGTPPGMPDQSGGMGNNPAVGGNPPIMNEPGMTRESQTGKMRGQ